jgi:ATP adenylyltransferase
MSERPLWAPWRIEYITGPKGEGCVFCDPDPEYVIDRREGCFSILNTYPYAPGHLMVAPARHVAGLEQLERSELLGLMLLAQRAITAARQALGPDGFNVGFNLGTVAGAGIADHLHLHVVPRWEGDNSFMPVLADTRVIPQALAVTRDLLVAALERGP